jgi:hypothetical protein
MLEATKPIARETSKATDTSNTATSTISFPVLYYISEGYKPVVSFTATATISIELEVFSSTEEENELPAPPKCIKEQERTTERANPQFVDMSLTLF